MSIIKIQKFMATPDGSLPEITLRFEDNAQHYQAITGLIGVCEVGINSHIWDAVSKKVTVAGDYSKTELLEKIKENLKANNGMQLKVIFGEKVPHLGLGIFADNTLLLNFEPSSDWTIEAVTKFFELLKSTKAIEITLDDEGECFSKEQIKIFNEFAN